MIRTHGFINYFGTQRFGNSSEVRTRQSATHLVGLAILQGDFQRAVELILSPRDYSHEDEREACEYFHTTKDVEGSLQKFPKSAVRASQFVERTILEGMIKGGGAAAYLNGLMNLPKNSRMIYIHAYQSYIWNSVVSERLRRSRQLCKD